MANSYKITRSNYTIKKRHQSVSGGVVYERDFMTTTNLGGWDSGSIPYGENNFKMYYRAIGNAKKRPYKGDWLQNDCVSGGSEFWTADCVPSSGTSEKEQIKIKPNFNSLLDFAYYGSCVELIKSTVTKIIKTFPAEMYVVGGADYGFESNILINNFEINLRDDIVPEGENELRYFLKSYSNYIIVTPDNIEYIESVILHSGSTQDFICGKFSLELHTIDENSEQHVRIIRSEVYKSGVKVLFALNFPEGTRIFPTEKYIENFFNGLDDFGKVLLNINTNPIYSAVLDTPFETERGVESYQRTYTWPVENGWNILIDGTQFHEYINGILSIAEFYDEYYTNNLWRMLTHDSIKAMDLAFSNPQKDEDQYDYNIGTSKLEGLFWAIGRQFDEIKRTIDNVKNTSNVTYNGNNNLPDYFLSDALSLGGWEVYNADSTLDKEEKIAISWPSGVTNNFGAEEANTGFLRNLMLNSKHILKKKGTRQGIESILGLFGMISYDEYNLLPESFRPENYDYKIDEYIGVVTDAIDAITGVTSGETDALLPLETANLLKNSIQVDVVGDRDTMEGIPCSYRLIQTNDGVIKYLIPWFDNKKEYDGGLYFQAKGGWGKHIIIYPSGKMIENGFDETVKYIIIVDTVPDLKNIPNNRLYNGVIAYVNDLVKNNNTEWVFTSHYFELENSDYSYLINQDNGWKNISEERIELWDEIGQKIYYIEHIVEDFKANNPHVGFGGYDMGAEYVAYLKNPLKYSIDKDKDSDIQMFYPEAYNCDGGLKFDQNTFEIDTNVVDNMKCWYFEPVSDTQNRVKLLEKTGFFTYEGIKDNSFSIGVSSTGKTFESEAFTYDFLNESSGDTVNDITNDSVVNTKVISITFIVDPDEEFKDKFSEYLNATVLPYLRQMLPSDAIFAYSIEERNVARASINRTTGGVVLTNINAIARDSDGSENNDVVTNFPVR